ncbi:hypothetical protein FPHYL_3638 [Fusarium phyllophilum]|uniref:Attractin/MKLN-like beta-propeller domain-containing protein n=1 Tax=Fusarium phyllophilum TaxID=47803 RepID=A0A8H5K3K2_9HYPO|nr:hypothetical protein FPHYL_3638 [Fusarium phyllophilum]
MAAKCWFLSIAVVVASLHLSIQHDPIKDFCRRFGHQTAVVDRKLYIDGGLVNWKPLETDPKNYTNTWLMWHDLDHNSKDNMPQIHANLSKNVSIPSVHGGALWADDVNYRLFLFGGEFFSGSPTTSNFMSYDIWYDQWDDYGPPSDDIKRVSYGAATTVKERGEGYYYGGYLSRASVSDWTGERRATSDLIRYQMDSNTWAKLSGPDDIRRAEGVMTFIPASDRGMLVYFGGFQDPGDNGTMISQPLDEIFLYDMISNKWHVQKANGTIPESRGRFCAGAIWAEDRSSYNIYINGGHGLEGPGFDDVYILSLPSFTWIKSYPLDQNGTGYYPSHSLSCDVINQGSQMLTIGGAFPQEETCDVEEVWGVHNIDLGNQIKSNFKKVWAGYEPSLFGYKVPSFVTSVIGGTEDGGATKLKPDYGFVNHDLGTLLSMKAVFTNRTRLDDGRTDPMAAASEGGSSSKSGLSTGAIIGIAVGAGVVVLAVPIGLWLFRRKRKAQRDIQSAPTTESFYSVPYMPQTSSPLYFPQSPDRWRRGSPGVREYEGGDPGQVHYWRPFQVNVEPCEMDGQGTRSPETHAEIEYIRSRGISH